MKIKPDRLYYYRPHLWYKLYSAMRDEGIPVEEMFFEDDVTLVSDTGFFSFAGIRDGIPYLRHFLVFRNKRWRFPLLREQCWNYLEKLGGYRKLLACIHRGDWRSMDVIRDEMGKNLQMITEDEQYQWFIVDRRKKQ